MPDDPTLRIREGRIPKDSRMEAGMRRNGNLSKSTTASKSLKINLHPEICVTETGAHSSLVWISSMERAPQRETAPPAFAPL
jgi:hypothetical protein